MEQDKRNKELNSETEKKVENEKKDNSINCVLCNTLIKYSHWGRHLKSKKHTKIVEKNRKTAEELKNLSLNKKPDIHMDVAALKEDVDELRKNVSDIRDDIHLLQTQFNGLLKFMDLLEVKYNEIDDKLSKL